MTPEQQSRFVEEGEEPRVQPRTCPACETTAPNTKGIYACGSMRYGAGHARFDRSSACVLIARMRPVVEAVGAYDLANGNTHDALWDAYATYMEATDGDA